jgi:hypothetical protein
LSRIVDASACQRGGHLKMPQCKLIPDALLSRHASRAWMAPWGLQTSSIAIAYMSWVCISRSRT